MNEFESEAMRELIRVLEKQLFWSTPTEGMSEYHIQRCIEDRMEAVEVIRVSKLALRLNGDKR